MCRVSVCFTFAAAATAVAATTFPSIPLAINVLPIRNSSASSSTLSPLRKQPSASATLNLSNNAVAAAILPPPPPPPPQQQQQTLPPQLPLPNDTVAVIAGEVEVDHLLIGTLAILALYCFVALRSGRRASHNVALADASGGGGTNTAMPGATRDSKKARGATRAQIESHLAHTTVTLYEGSVPLSLGQSAINSHDVQFDQQQCAICLDFLAPRDDEPKSSVRILRCAHAFHAACIDSWLLRCNQCPCCLKQPW